MGSATHVLDRADALVGGGVERLVRSHHRRRLRRIRRDDALDAGPGWWSSQATPPREGCTLRLHVDGQEALARVAEALEAAERHVHLAGWFFSPDFRLRRGPGEPALADL